MGMDFVVDAMDEPSSSPAFIDNEEAFSDGVKRSEELTPPIASPRDVTEVFGAEITARAPSSLRRE